MTLKSATFENVYGENEISIHMKHVSKEFYQEDCQLTNEEINDWYIDKMIYRCDEYMKPNAKKLYNKVSDKGKEKLKDLLIEYLWTINFI